MHLCFGAIAFILSSFQTMSTQAILVARLALCLDERSNYVEFDQRHKEDKSTIEGDRYAASKLIHLRKNFVFSDPSLSSNVDLASVTKLFKEGVEPLIDEDKKALILLILLHIIRNDDLIEKEKSQTFKRFFGHDRLELLQQTEFIFSDFLSRALMYTTCGKVNNIFSHDFTADLKEAYIPRIPDIYQNEYEWDAETETLSLCLTKAFNTFNDFEQSLRKYDILSFIDKVDPSVQMNIKYAEQCDEFIKELRKTRDDTFCFTDYRVQDFVDVLDEYTTYLPLNMIPLDWNMDIVVPKFRDENLIWANDFLEETYKYRCKLADIYQEIYRHLHFMPHILNAQTDC